VIDPELLTLLSRAKTNSVPLSYAQNLEDYHLSLAFAGAPAGTYIDIGGGHPVAGSVSFWFYERGWQGIVVEPQSELAALYKRVRRRDLVTAAWLGGRAARPIFIWSIVCTGSRRRAKTWRKQSGRTTSTIGRFASR